MMFFIYFVLIGCFKGVKFENIDKGIREEIINIYERNHTDFLEKFLTLGEEEKWRAYREELLKIMNENGDTLLHRACIEGKTKMLITLLKFDEFKDPAILNKGNRQGNTVMHIAHFKSDVSIMVELREAGALVDSKNARGEMPIDVIRTSSLSAAKDYNNRILAIDAALIFLLNEEYDTEDFLLAEKDKSYRKYAQILHRALKTGQYWVLKDPVLKQIGLLINEEDQDGNTPMHLATMLDVAVAFDDLIEEGANPYSKNRDGKTPLEFIKSKGVLGLAVKSEWKKGRKAEVFLKHKYKNDNTLLHVFAERAKEDFVEDTNGEKKMKENYENLMKETIKYGANKEELNSDMLAPVDILALRSEIWKEVINNYRPSEQEKKEIEELESKYIQEARNKEMREEITKEERKNYDKALNREYRLDIDLVKEGKRKAIHFAIDILDIPGLITLLELGSKPEWIDDSEVGRGRNCYEIALDRYRPEIFEELLKYEESICCEYQFKKSSVLHLVASKKSDFMQGKFLRIVLDKIRKQKDWNWELVRSWSDDPIEKIIENDDSEMLKELMSLGLCIEHHGKNILVEAIDARKSKIVGLIANNISDSDMLEITKHRDDDNISMLHKILRSNFKDSNFELMFKKIIKSSKLSDLTYQDRYGDEKSGVSSVFNLCLESPKSIWLEYLIDNLLERKNSGTRDVEQEKTMSSYILDKIVELSTKNRHEHIRELVRYFDEDIYDLFGASDAKGKENIVAKFMYALANKKGNETIIKDLLRIFHQKLYTRWDIVKDRYKGAMPEIGTKILEMGLGFVPLIGPGIESILELAKPALQEFCQVELKEKYESVKMVYEIYTKGEWTEGIEFEEEMLGFFNDHKRIFETSDSNTVLSLLIKGKRGQEVEKCSDYLLLESSNLWKVVNAGKQKYPTNMEKVENELKIALDSALKEIDEYGELLDDYKNLLNDLSIKSRQVNPLSIQALKVSKDILLGKKKEPISKEEGKKFMQKHNELIRKRVDLVNLSTKNYELPKLSKEAYV